MTAHLRTPILRHPGQSLDEQLAKMNDDDFVPIAAMITLFILLAILEWICYIWVSCRSADRLTGSV